MGKPETEETLVEKAFALATKYHKGQFRNDGITPYITHPIAVANNFKDEKYAATALLHDVLEDCKDVQPQDLIRAGIPEDVVEAVVFLTRLPPLEYKDYILELRRNKMACAVKIADIEHNIQTVTNKDKRDKYNLALYILKGALNG